MKSNRSNAIAILLALTMTASALAGCTGTDDDVGDEPVELQDWGVYSVQSSSDLPTCDSATDGRLYYVSSESGFHACSNGAWQSIELTGPPGPQEPKANSYSVLKHRLYNNILKLATLNI